MNTNIARKKTNISGVLKYAIYLICLAFIAVVAFVNPNFIKPSNFVVILQQAAPFFIASSGMALVILSGGIDISGSEQMLLSAIAATYSADFIIASAGAVFPKDSFQLYFACMMIAMVIGGLIGFLNGYFITIHRMIPFIATLAMLNIVKGIALVITKGQSRNLTGLSAVVSTRIAGVFPAVIVFSLLILFILNFVVRRTAFGRRLRAVGNNAQNAQKIGIDVTKTKIIVHTICGMCCGIAGMISATQINFLSSAFAEGNNFLIISATVLGGVSMRGGRGNVFPGAFIGIILIQMIVNGLTMMGANAYIYKVVRGVLIFLAVLIESGTYKGDLK